VNAKLIARNYETEHRFQVIRDRINIPYDGILGKDFFRANNLPLINEKRNFHREINIEIR
jgi:hypothetical protein